MFGSLGFPEILFILVLALLIFGPRKLPEIGRTIGRSLAEFRKASTDLKRSLNAEMIEEEMRQSDPRKILDDEPPAGGSAARPEPPPVGEAPAAETGAAESAPVPRGSVPRGGDETADGSAPGPETVPEPEAP